MRIDLSDLPRSARLDLHLHSDRSDGCFSVDEVLRRAAAGGLDVISITDHDLAPSAELGVEQFGGQTLRVLRGCEVSGTYEGTELHLLVYFAGPVPEAFRSWCRGLAAARAERYERARAAIGLPGVPAADAAALAGDRALTRLHLSRALHEAGHVRSVREAFDLWTGDEHHTVPAVQLDFLEAIRVARAHGGLTSWAHPPLEKARQWTKRFARAGLQGLEVYRPGPGPMVRRSLKRLTLKHGLFPTGGSDWHGWSRQQLGAFALDPQQTQGFGVALRAA